MGKYTKNYIKLADFGRELLYRKSLEEGLPHISKYAKEIIGADRCSIFMYDAEKKELWTTIADGVEKIVVDSSSGLVGETLKVKKPIVENDVYNNPLFLQDIDKSTGYKTQSIITSPIFNSTREIIGVLQLINKEDGFDKDDSKFMVFFSHYVSGFLELVHLYDKEGLKNV